MANKFDPLKELNNLRQSVGRVIEQGLQSVTSIGQLIRLDIYETEDKCIIRTSAIDGIVPDSIDVTVDGNTLTISGETRPEPTPNNASFLLQERKFGAFSRTVTIPLAIVSTQAKAKLKDGVLTITLPIHLDDKEEM